MRCPRAILSHSGSGNTILLLNERLIKSVLVFTLFCKQMLCHFPHDFLDIFGQSIVYIGGTPCCKLL